MDEEEIVEVSTFKDGKISESSPLVTTSDLTLKMKSGLYPMRNEHNGNIGKLFRSSATTAQSWGDKPFAFRISFRTSALPSDSMTTPLMLPVKKLSATSKYKP